MKLSQQFRSWLFLWSGSLTLTASANAFGDAIEVVGTRHPIPQEMPVGSTETTMTRPAGVFSSSADGDSQQSPRFEQYPVEQIVTGAPAPVAITPKWRSVSNRRWETAPSPNFAGHYRLTSWNDGADCVTGAVVDVQNGRRYPLPDAACPQSEAEPGGVRRLEFQPGSNLLIVRGEDEKGQGDGGRHYYRFENGRFVYLGSVQPE